MSYIGPLILQVVLIALNAIFASAEIAVISMNDTKLQKMAKEGDARAKRLVALTEQPTKFLSTIQVAITLAGLLGSAFAAENFAGALVAAIQGTGVGISAAVLETFAVFVITLVLAYFNLVFGELVPKRVGMKKAEGLALGMSGMLTMVSKFFAPLVWLLTASTNGILKLLGINPEDEDETVSEEEIYMMLEVGAEKGTIDKEETEWIRNVFAFDDTSVDEVCTHRVDVTALGLEESDEEWKETILQSRFTYYPVYREDQDDIVGVLNTKDYFRLEEQSRENVLTKAVEKPYYVPETMKADVLFHNMKKERKHFAVVLDEYGGLSGVISMHDLMELLVGDLDEDEKEIVSVGENTWRISGGASLDDVAEELEIKLPVEEYDTFGGYIFGELGKIPDDGAKFVLEAGGMKIQVEKVENHRIIETVVKYEKPAEEQNMEG
ncbi:MAG: HlyC/CorC family transporter [Anaerotignum sp.]|nr:HlyC/CorC family transporter [Anaerotignum sp.]MBP3629737.1 HlyC/CorC family transporter [Anaerotignum sp.]